MPEQPGLAAPVRAMHSIAPPEKGKTRFIDHIVEGAPDDLEIQTFTWKTAFAGGYDVFHIHWPERLLRKGRIKTLALMAVLRLRRVPIVRTLHNIKPHEGGSSLESALLKLIDRQTALFVRLNQHTPIPPGAAFVMIPHPHYLPRISTEDVSPVRGRVLYFGIVRPYKGIASLLDAFEATDDDSISLRIVGSATGDRGDGVRSAMERDSRITADLRYVPDVDLDDEIRAAEVVVLPYRQMHNSGALFLALSHARPVLVPKSDVNEDIADEVGSDWLIQFDGDVSADDLLRAISVARSRAIGGAPDLRERDWDRIGISLRDAYLKVLDRSPRLQ